VSFAASLVGRIELQVGTRCPAVSAASISSYEHVLQGIWHFRKMTPAAIDIAAGCFERAIAAHPENAEAHRWLSGCHFSRWLIEFSRDEQAKGFLVAARSVELDPASALCHTAVGFSQIWSEGLDVAAASFERAFALNPGDPDVLTAMAQLEAYGGDLAASRDFLAQALRLNPLPPLWFGEYRAIGDFIEGRYAEALPAFQAIPDAAFDATYALACAGQLGDRAQIAACKSRFPAARQGGILLAAAKAEPFRDPEPRRRLVAGLEWALAD
jgi:tetratricopeptide (TPR) repeat protein